MKEVRYECQSRRRLTQFSNGFTNRSTEKVSYLYAVVCCDGPWNLHIRLYKYSRNVFTGTRFEIFRKQSKLLYSLTASRAHPLSFPHILIYFVKVWKLRSQVDNYSVECVLRHASDMILDGSGVN